MPRRLSAFALQVFVLLALAGTAVAWADSDKKVSVSIDGQVRVVRTHAATVGGVLDRAHIDVHTHDTLAPGRQVAVKDGARIAIRRGRLVAMTIDGQTRQVWVTARSVDELLDQLGMRTSQLWLSASRSRRIPLSGLDLGLRTAKQATVVVDGRSLPAVTTVATVGDLLALLHVSLGPNDTTSVPVDAQVTEGVVVTVNRVGRKVETISVLVPQHVVKKSDATLYVGRSKVLARGAPGVVRQVWSYAIMNGKVVGKRMLSAVVVSRPTDKVLAVGTKPAPAAAPTSAGGLNWAALAKCESGGNPKAVNPAGYYGLYQFTIGTWHSVGGAGVPTDASASEQTYRAQILYQRRGSSPWPACGHFLFS